MPRPDAAHRQPDTGMALVAAADALLALAAELRATRALADAALLQARIGELLREFQARMERRGMGATRIEQATQALCALLDESIAAMPWGAGLRAAPADRAFAPARDRGAAPADRLLALAGETAGDRELQELIGVALALGFEARGAAAESATVRHARSLAFAGGVAEAGALALSPDWSPAVRASRALASWLPLWALALALAAGLAVAYFGLRISLGMQSDRVYGQIAALRLPAGAALPPAAAAAPRLAQPLAALVASQFVALREERDRSIVLLPGPTWFEPGGAQLRAATSEALRALAAALQAAPGRIQVIGHTGAGGAGRSARYPSDWDLSVDRARALSEALQALGVDGARLAFDGRADTEPLAAAEAARMAGGDERVEVILLAGR